MCFIHLICLNHHSLHFKTSVICHPCHWFETTVDYRQCCFPCRNRTVAGLNQVWRFLNLLLWSSRKQSVEDWTISERMCLHANDRSFLAVPGAKELTWKIRKKICDEEKSTTTRQSSLLRHYHDDSLMVLHATYHKFYPVCCFAFTNKTKIFFGGKGYFKIECTCCLQFAQM
jgi:hypothetical protein